MEILENPIILSDMEDIYSRHIDFKKIQNKTILVTGAYGMLASYLVFFFIYLNEFQDFNIHIVAQVRNEEKARKIFGIYGSKSYFHIYTKSLLEPWEDAEKADYIFHAASLANPQCYTTCPVEVAEPNAIGTYYLLNYAIKQKVQGILLFSSGDVYGKISGVENISEKDYGIMDPLDIHSCYGESKRMLETWGSLFAYEYNVPVTIARIAHTYGPTMDINHDPRVFASFMKAAIQKEDIVMYSDGTTKRPFCYIADAVAAFLTIILKGKAGEAYNLVNSKEFLSIRDLATLISSLPESHPLKVIMAKRDSNDGYLENKNNAANKPIERKLKELGWECHYTAKSGFKRVYDYLSMQS